MLLINLPPAGWPAIQYVHPTQFMFAPETISPLLLVFFFISIFSEIDRYFNRGCYVSRRAVALCCQSVVVRCALRYSDMLGQWWSTARADTWSGRCLHGRPVKPASDRVEGLPLYAPQRRNLVPIALLKTNTVAYRNIQVSCPQPLHFYCTFGNAKGVHRYVYAVPIYLSHGSCVAAPGIMAVREKVCRNLIPVKPTG